MKYRDEIHIAMMALVFSCAMFAIYAVVPKDAIVAAKARATVTEAPETAAEAEAIRFLTGRRCRISDLYSGQ